VRQAYRIFWLAFALGLIGNLAPYEGNAARSETSDNHVDRLNLSQSTNLQAPRSRWSADTPQYIAANEQTAQAAEPQPREQDEPDARKRSSERQQPAGPVGVAPASPQEILPSWMTRTFDLPGAGVLTPKGTLIVEPYLQFPI
jgi:hypothetical protein